MDLLYDTKMDREGIQEDINVSVAHSFKQYLQQTLCTYVYSKCLAGLFASFL